MQQIAVSAVWQIVTVCEISRLNAGPQYGGFFNILTASIVQLSNTWSMNNGVSESIMNLAHANYCEVKSM